MSKKTKSMHEDAGAIQVREVAVLKEAQCYLAGASRKIKQTNPQNDYNDDVRTNALIQVSAAFAAMDFLIAERGAGSKFAPRYDRVHKPSHGAAVMQACNHEHHEDERCTVNTEKLRALSQSRQQVVREALAVLKFDGVELSEFEEQVLATKTAVQ